MISDQAIKSIKDLDSLLDFLRDELDWPIEEEDLETLTYEHYADELGLDSKYENMISSIRQLRPLVDGQPWGIFFIDFEKKSLPVGALRKILSGLVFSKRRNTEYAVWDKSELLFICSLKYEENLIMGFVHFKDSDSTVPSINTFYWDVNKETILNFKSKLERLAWPNDISKIDEWKRTWSSAFTTVYRETIRQSKQLVEQLAMLAQNTKQRVLEAHKVESSKGALHKLFSKFQELLIHDLSINNFADMYAQTVAYGLFSARCMDTDGHFELSEVVDRIPTTNPFLKQLLKNCFEHGLGNSSSQMFDELAIGEIVDLLDHTDTKEILDDWGRQTGGGLEDPVIHFYEGFLNEYEHEQKKRRGVYYTPDPVVSFIVRSVDEILRDDFGYTDGLADISTKKIKYQKEALKQKRGTQTKYVTDTKEVPAIQILDPATGTGTFLAHTIRKIKANFENKHQDKSADEIKKLWNEYVPQHLLPRLNGFEIMMAPYSVAHMKLGLILKETGYDFHDQDRLNVYLTNTLEEAGSEEITLFDLLSAEASGANKIKNNKGINVVIGNPPYSGESANKGEWIMNIIEDYKKEPDSIEKLKEANSKFINDDYVKFIRYAENVLANNKQAVLAYINAHGFIDNPTFRGMRWHLLKSFDKIFILDLHGNAKKREMASDGSKDENVFDIQQGVSINIFIKANSEASNNLAQVFHADFYGTRNDKYLFLNNNTLRTIQFEKVNIRKPNYLFVNVDELSLQKRYEKGFSVRSLFLLGSLGILTKRDSLTVAYSEAELEDKIHFFLKPDISTDEACARFSLPTKDKDKWDAGLSRSRIDLNSVYKETTKILYRPFDYRYLFNNEYFVARQNNKVLKHVRKDSPGLLLCRQGGAANLALWDTCFITESVSDQNIFRRGGGTVLPLYFFDNTYGIEKKNLNLNMHIVKFFCDRVNLSFQPINTDMNKTQFFTSIDLFDYIYAILYCPSYRETYKEFLKIDFPHVPYPKNQELFWQLIKFGGELRQLHLLESPVFADIDAEMPIEGRAPVEKPTYRDGKVFINKVESFTNVSETAWEFYIGGYQPAQKWLKDRKGRVLSSEDIKHYKKIIRALTETDRIMKEIDEIVEEHGGW